MYGLLLALHILICFSLIVVVLLQSGKGGGLAGGAFGGTAQTVFRRRRPRVRRPPHPPASRLPRARGRPADRRRRRAIRRRSRRVAGDTEPARSTDSQTCPGGGTGRHVRLRGVWGNPCEFKSRPGHQSNEATPRGVAFSLPGLAEALSDPSAREEGTAPWCSPRASRDPDSRARDAPSGRCGR